MVQLSAVLVALAATSVGSALPMQKRIAQTIADSTTKWVAACTAAGGGSKCNTVSQNAFQTLLAAGGNCDQQDAADQMVDLAKKLNNNADMINLSQIFAQQPRNAPDSLQVPYCQKAPQNAELNGFFHCQFAGSDFTKFSGDQTGNLPLGVSAVNPPGSCPAKTDGPVPDGVQLNTLVSSPGTPEGGAAGAATSSANSTAVDSSSASNSTAVDSSSASNSTAVDSSLASNSTAVDSSSASNSTSTASLADASQTSASNSTAASDNSTASSASGDGSSDNSSDNSAAASGSDAGAASANSASANATGTAAAASAGASNGAAAGAKPFTLQNGQDAQKLNKQFKSLSATSSCQDGTQACVGGAFAQCVGGKFQSTQCSGGTQCFALPLVNKAGTSVTCATAADAQSRIANTGATGGVDGSS